MTWRRRILRSARVSGRSGLERIGVPDEGPSREPPDAGAGSSLRVGGAFEGVPAADAGKDGGARAATENESAAPGPSGRTTMEEEPPVSRAMIATLPRPRMATATAAKTNVRVTVQSPGKCGSCVVISGRGSPGDAHLPDPVLLDSLDDQLRGRRAGRHRHVALSDALGGDLDLVASRGRHRQQFGIGG
jgi:hypothetical protein